MQLIHILPRKNLSRDLAQRYELYLADEIRKNPTDYSMCVRGNLAYKILDNSLNELGVSASLEAMELAAGTIWPDEFVIPDDVDPEKSRALMEQTLGSLGEYPNLVQLRRMAVVHARTFESYLAEMLRLSKDSRVDVVGIPKTVATLLETEPGRRDGRVVLLACAIGMGYSKTTHFLGWTGFREFEGHEEFVNCYVRSMDSRLMLVSKDLWNRDDVLSHVDLENSEIPNIREEMRRVGKEARKSGIY